MQVLVRYFHNLRDIASTDAERIQLDKNATVRDLMSRLACRHEGLAHQISALNLVVNDEVADAARPLHEGDTIDVIPSQRKC